MAEEAYPFDNTPAASEVQWSRMARLWQMDGVDTLPSGGSLKVTTVSGLNVSVAAGNATVRGIYYHSDTAKTIGLVINNAATARIDRVVLRIDTTTNIGTPIAITGTAATSPVPPAMTYTETVFDLPLAECRVEANDTISTINDRRRFVGRPVVPCTSTNRPDPQGRPLLAFEEDTNRVIFNDGTNGAAWVVGMGEDVFRPSYAYSGATGHTTSTNWTSVLADASSNQSVTETFSAPPSGQCLFTIGAFLGNDKSNESTYLAIRLVKSDGTTYWGTTNPPSPSGDRFMSMNVPPATGGAGIGGASCSSTYQATSLTPNATYTATLMYRVSGGQATYDSRFIRIDPMP